MTARVRTRLLSEKDASCYAADYACTHLNGRQVHERDETSLRSGKRADLTTRTEVTTAKAKRMWLIAAECTLSNRSNDL